MSETSSADIVRVNFQFRRELATKLEGNLASFCYQCGACVGDCLAADYSERFSPREIMLKVLYGLDQELLCEDSVLWECANCYNCQERCPQQVKPVEVIIALKNMLADRQIIPKPVEQVIKTFEETGRTVPFNPAINRQRERFGLSPLKPAPIEEIRALLQRPSSDDQTAVAPDSHRSQTVSSLAPEESRSQSASPAKSSVAPKGTPQTTSPLADAKKRYAFFPGCLIAARYPAMEFTIRQTLPRLGIEVVDLEGASCCPDPIYFKSKDKLNWLAVAARNLTLAEERGVDVFTCCSGCTATLSEAHHLLEDENVRGRVNERLKRIGREYRGTSRIRNIMPLLRDQVGFEAIRKSVVRPLEGLKVAIHYGCHMLKPSRIMKVDDPNDPSVLEELVRALGATPVRHRNWYLCCGKACQSEAIPATMMRDLLRTVHDEHPDLLCLICPTCFGQFDHGQLNVANRFREDFHTPAIYYAQLLAFAQGTPYDQLGLERQRFKPECLIRYEASSAS